MRAQCCICADLFENSTSVNIAAAPCGHTFHETCLMRWMDTSSTCPSCRTTVKKNLIIKRLFFDAVDDLNGDDNDTDRLLNQVGNLKAQLIEKEKKEAELKESRDSYMCRLASSESLCAELTIKLNHKHDHIDMLQKSLGTLQKENAAYMEEMMAYHKTKKKLVELESLNSLLKATMRAQCCICADLFENSTSVNIAAAPCGHTFHETCLMRWMDTSSTCPSCRTTVKKNLIIKRLFFDAVDDLNGDDNDTDRLLNQVGNLK
ncbi:hypothetical protein Btru_042626, partial [Bulinus truncatus]